MAKHHAVEAAQAELSALGESGVVIDVQRHRREAQIVLASGKIIRVEGWLALKLLKMLKTRYGAEQWPQSKKKRAATGTS